MLRVAMVVVALAGCGRAPTKATSTAGTTQATAITISLVQDADKNHPTLRGKLQLTPPVPTPRWFVVTLPTNDKRDLSVTVHYDGAARSVDVELIDPAGHTAARARPGEHHPHFMGGWRSAYLERARGTYFVRVTTVEGAERYRLSVSSTAITPPPRVWPSCNPFVFDAENPNCKGVVPCDPNKPVSTNPACCTNWCIRGECPGVLLSAADSEGFYAWLDLGAENGITVWYSGYASLALLDGTRGKSNIRVVEVERNRSKVFVSKELDPARLHGNFVRLRLPPQCAQ